MSSGMGESKSWKKINEERKVLKKQRKQEKLLKSLKRQQKQDEETAENAKAKDNNVPQTVKENPSTISIAVPGSILENAQSIELRTYVAGQIARAACIFRVNEVIVFDDIGLSTARETKADYNAKDEDNYRTVRNSCLQLARILQYLECPQYLRKFFFPLHKDLKYSGLLNPLDAPHHLRQDNIFRYREGIVTEKAAKPGHCYVNVGLLNDVLVNKAIEPGFRVTVKLDNPEANVKKQRASVVSPDEPRRESGVYWGYTIRIAHSITEIFTKSPYPKGYDLTVGTSDRGKNIHEFAPHSMEYSHLLLVFGGLQGLDGALASDDKLQIDDPELLFDHYVNVLPKQGSRTIRTEEAILIALAAMQEKFHPLIPDSEVEIIKGALPRSEDTGGATLKPREIKSKKKDLKRKLKEEETGETHLKTTKTVSEDFNGEKGKKAGENPFKNSANISHNKANGTQEVGFEIVPANIVISEFSNNDTKDLSKFD
uniref:RNA methyltransferase n=1 Tax=Glossina austeni TaxID=7395 RepID=A0A1A9VIE0_GLOAU